MKVKKFEHQVIEKCKISGKPIDTTKEKYCILLECTGDEIDSIGFYKNLLLKEIIKGKMENVTKELLQKHQTIAGKMVKGLNSIMGFNPAQPSYQIGGKI